MPNSTVTCSFTAVAVAITVADLSARMAAVPIDFTLPNLWGLYLTNDTTSAVGVLVTRQFTFKMIPTVADATATATLKGGSSGQQIAAVTVTGAGGLYARPPLVTFSGGTPTATATAVANMAVSGFTIIKGGSSYAAPTVAFVGGELAPGGIAVQATATQAAGVINSVTVTNPNNGPYISAPLVVINDGPGTGAEVIAGLAVNTVTVTSPGQGFGAVPNVVFTPLFKQQAPDTSSQAATMNEFMQLAFQANVFAGIVPATAVS